MITRLLDRWLLMPTLWHSLHHALPRHPLLWYRQSGGRLTLAAVRGWRRWAVYAIIVVVVFNVFTLWSIVDFPLGLLIPLVGLVIGIHVAANISVRLAYERECGRCELTALTPSGLLGASWAVATRYFQRDPLLRRLCYYVDLVHILWLFAGLLLLTFSLFLSIGAVSFRQQNLFGEAVGLHTTLNLLLILVLVRADYQYSLVAAALIAMIAPTFARNRLESYLIALAGFLVVQVLVFILWLLIGGTVSGLVWNVVGPDAPLLNTFAILALYLIIREGWLHAICVMLALRLHTTRREILGISRLSI
jgi:hypothetical protein